MDAPNGCDEASNEGDDGSTRYKTKLLYSSRVSPPPLQKPVSVLNGDAAPFVPPDSIGDSNDPRNINGRNTSTSYETFTLKVPLDGKIWKNISARSSQNRYVAAEADAKRYRSATSIFETAPDRTMLFNVLPNGVLHVYRRDNIHIDITLDKAIRVAFPVQSILVTVSNSATAVAVFHPNGRIIQNNSRVDVTAFDGSRSNNYVRYAKLWYKGVSFTAKDIPLVYLVDEAGLRTTVDRFPELKAEHALDVFHHNAQCGEQFFKEAVKVLGKSTHSLKSDGSEAIEINQIRIVSCADGTISIQRPNNKCSIRINPRKIAITLTTSQLHCTASMGASPHLFLRRGDRRIHFDGTTFCVRNAGHSAGFNEKNQVTIFNKKNTPSSF